MSSFKDKVRKDRKYFLRLLEKIKKDEDVSYDALEKSVRKSIELSDEILSKISIYESTNQMSISPKESITAEYVTETIVDTGRGKRESEEKEENKMKETYYLTVEDVLGEDVGNNKEDNSDINSMMLDTENNNLEDKKEEAKSSGFISKVFNIFKGK